ncbi:hypothetical protein PHLCEN_2v8568 [Hermanssonia centrifuga]|uniref:F-box domain-containing protein n=1 Tax=Hermanssonia centrifuga TaxID=98765 RepID=A0A2R6NU04_9APHY|nr:hypothetical protein PHLCEN_2v8568 [Hermanssonia centrifuga]
MPATAADLPPDLFKNILDCLQTSSRSPYHGENSIVAVTKHELAACSLTCSYWATACRPRIFTHITLRSREDVYTLLSFIEQPNSPLPGYIKFIRISSVLSGLPQPWIYLVPLLSSPKLNPFIDKELYISQPLDSDGKDRVVDLNLHLALPSSVPSTPFIDFSDIALTDIHLNTYSDLSRFVRTTPFLGWLRCERIAWTTAQEETLLPGSSRTSYITYVTMEKCTENWKAMDLLLGATYLMFHLPGSFMEGRHPNGRQYRRLLLDVTERLSVVALVRSIQSVIDSEQSLQPYVSTSAEPFTGEQHFYISKIEFD